MAKGIGLGLLALLIGGSVWLVSSRNGGGVDTLCVLVHRFPWATESARIILLGREGHVVEVWGRLEEDWGRRIMLTRRCATNIDGMGADEILSGRVLPQEVSTGICDPYAEPGFLVSCNFFSPSRKPRFLALKGGAEMY